MLKTNIVLIGMPSSGKTSVGKPLSETLDMGFVDTDLMMKERAGKPLRDIVKEEGLEAFLRLQEETLLELEPENQVVSTGGSVVYNSGPLTRLGENSIIFYLKTTLEELEKRITPERRLARNNGQSYADVYAERAPLYEKHSDVVIDCDGKTVEDIVMEIAGEWKARKDSAL